MMAILRCAQNDIVFWNALPRGRSGASQAAALPTLKLGKDGKRNSLSANFLLASFEYPEYKPHQVWLMTATPLHPEFRKGLEEALASTVFQGRHRWLVVSS